MPMCYQTGADHLARVVAADVARIGARVDAVLARHRRGLGEDQPGDEPLEPLACPACRRTFEFGYACPACDVLLTSASWVGTEPPRRIPPPPPWWAAPAGRLASVTLATAAILVWVGVFITVYPHIDHVVPITHTPGFNPRVLPSPDSTVRETSYVHLGGSDVSLRTLDVDGLWLPRLLVTLDDPAASGDLELELTAEGENGPSVGSCHRHNCRYHQVGPDWGLVGYWPDDPIWIGAADFAEVFKRRSTSGFAQVWIEPSYPGEPPPDPLGTRDHPWPTEMIALDAPAAGAYAVSLQSVPGRDAPPDPREVRIRVYADGGLLLDQSICAAGPGIDITVGRVTFPGATLIPS
jgi:hypothetical protein